MSTRTHGFAPSTMLLVHFFGRGLVDDGRCYAVESLVFLSNRGVRRQPADAARLDKTRGGSNTRGRHARRGPGHAPGI